MNANLYDFQYFTCNRGISHSHSNLHTFLSKWREYLRWQIRRRNHPQSQTHRGRDCFQCQCRSQHQRISVLYYPQTDALVGWETYDIVRLFFLSRYIALCFLHLPVEDFCAVNQCFDIIFFPFLSSFVFLIHVLFLFSVSYQILF